MSNIPKKEKHINHFEELKKKYSCGSLIKKKSCKGRTIRVESLDIDTANRINERVSRLSKQYQAESQNGLKLANETYSN